MPQSALIKFRKKYLEFNELPEGDIIHFLQQFSYENRISLSHLYLQLSPYIQNAIKISLYIKMVRILSPRALQNQSFEYMNPHGGERMDGGEVYIVFREDFKESQLVVLFRVLSDNLKRFLTVKAEYRGLDREGYGLAEYTKIITCLKKILNSSQLPTEEFFVYNFSEKYQNLLIVDINWPRVKWELVRYLVRKKLINISQAVYSALENMLLDNPDVLRVLCDAKFIHDELTLFEFILFLGKDLSKSVIKKMNASALISLILTSIERNNFDVFEQTISHLSSCSLQKQKEILSYDHDEVNLLLHCASFPKGFLLLQPIFLSMENKSIIELLNKPFIVICFLTRVPATSFKVFLNIINRLTPTELTIIATPQNCFLSLNWAVHYAHVTRLGMTANILKILRKLPKEDQISFFMHLNKGQMNALALTVRYLPLVAVKSMLKIIFTFPLQIQNEILVKKDRYHRNIRHHASNPEVAELIRNYLRQLSRLLKSPAEQFFTGTHFSFFKLESKENEPSLGLTDVTPNVIRDFH